MKKRVLVAGLWLATSFVDYGLMYASMRHMQVNDWPLTAGSRPGAIRSARILSAMAAIAGPFSLPACGMAEAMADVPGWHVNEWATLKDEGAQP